MTIADRVLILLASTSIALFAYLTWQPSTAADRVEIITPFEKKVVSLQNDKTLFIKGVLGNSELRIQHQRIRFIASPCTTKFCVHQGWAQHSGDIRACLPNQVSLRLLGRKSVFDSVTF